jgi:uncharacterized membrane protein
MFNKDHERLILGVFGDTDNAEDAIDDLREFGLNPKDISIVMKDKEGREELAGNTGANVAGSAASGAATGGVIGGIAGLLIGIGAIAIPGVGALLIGGPLAAALGLTGAAATTVSGAVTGALAGGIVGALVGLGLPEHEAREYEDRIKQGGILVVIPSTRGREDEIRDILSDNGADQIKAIDFDEQRVRERYHEHRAL